jgi:hypothetical protein
MKITVNELKTLIKQTIKEEINSLKDNPTNQVLKKETINLKDLELVDDELKKALEDASKESNTKEEIFTIGSFLIAIPNIVKALIYIVEKISKTNKINLDKTADKRAWTTVVMEMVEKIDEYIDTPVRMVLKPFIKDQNKVNNVARILKATVLTLAGSVQAFDPTNAAPLLNVIKDLAPELGVKLSQVVINKNKSALTSILKQYFNKLVI